MEAYQLWEELGFFIPRVEKDENVNQLPLANNIFFPRS
jgi:hypothetical protein